MSKVKSKITPIKPQRRTPKAIAKLQELPNSRVTVLRKLKPGRVADAGRICPVCNCTEKDPCQVQGCPCGWVAYRGQLVCTACAPIEALLGSGSGREWLQAAMQIAASNAQAVSAGVVSDYRPCKSLAKQLAEA